MAILRDEEFSGNSSCSDCTPELASVVIEAFRMISIANPDVLSVSTTLTDVVLDERALRTWG